MYTHIGVLNTEDARHNMLPGVRPVLQPVARPVVQPVVLLVVLVTLCSSSQFLY